MGKLCEFNGQDINSFIDTFELLRNHKLAEAIYQPIFHSLLVNQIFPKLDAIKDV